MFPDDVRFVNCLSSYENIRNSQPTLNLSRQYKVLIKQIIQYHSREIHQSVNTGALSTNY